MPTAPQEPRKTAGVRLQNPRGGGSRLREDIIKAARKLLEASGVEEAVTLRATAREAGISAPAIYAHFDDRMHMVEAVISQAFDDFTAAVTAPLRTTTDPVQGLVESCSAYLTFAHEHPATYQILFARHRPSEVVKVGQDAAVLWQVLISSIEACVAAQRSSSQDPAADSVLVWLGLHGAAALPPAHPRFPWPDPHATARRLLARLAQIPELESR